MAQFVMPGVVADPYVFTPQPGADMVLVARTAWAAAQLAHRRLVDVDERIEAVNQRQQDGHAWFATHDEHDPHYARARQLKGELLDALGLLRIERQCEARACWLDCATTYAALSLARVQGPADIDDELPAALTHPRQVWAVLRGNEKPPGNWPPLPSEWNVELRIAQTPVWDLEQIEAALAKRAAPLPRAAGGVEGGG